MKKILVPIDNSNVSKGALMHAVNLASSMNAKIILLSVITTNTTPSTLLGWRLLEDRLVKKEREGAARMVREVLEETNTRVKISHQHIFGISVQQMIDGFVRENRIDFVVMGTSGAKGLAKIGGTHTASVINLSSVPVLAIPKDASLTKIKKIVYATDMAHLDDEIRTVVNFAKLFDAEIEIVYVTDVKHKIRSNKELASILISMAKYPRIRFNTIEAGTIAKGLETFVTKQKADLLAMFTHKLDFFEKLFGKSVTRNLAFSSHVPLLAINKSNI